ncbi:MAG: DUF1294 domain-containing protein [Comamonadaceae bacterium]|nr:MAG: DUF1294 domain-containing protein [Comamonadaceae bacterium]
MRIHGTLISWNDERGFGFIEPSQGGQEIFVHIKAFPSSVRRPVIGQVLSFEVALAPNGKKRAQAVQLPARAPASAQARAAARPRFDAPAPWSPLRLLVVPAFLGLLAYAAVFWNLRPLVPALYAAMSLLTFFAYAFDKSAAIARRWRTPENTLHLMALAGGWPGALLAQQWLRHKSSKRSFIAVFWVTVLLNVGVFVAWHMGLLGQLALPR